MHKFRAIIDTDLQRPGTLACSGLLWIEEMCRHKLHLTIASTLGSLQLGDCSVVSCVIAVKAFSQK